eukprot:3128050-Rhodomonas_salina.4
MIAGSFGLVRAPTSSRTCSRRVRVWLRRRRSERSTTSASKTTSSQVSALLSLLMDVFPVLFVPRFLCSVLLLYLYSCGSCVLCSACSCALSSSSRCVSHALDPLCDVLPARCMLLCQRSPRACALWHAFALLPILSPSGVVTHLLRFSQGLTCALSPPSSSSSPFPVLLFAFSLLCVLARPARKERAGLHRRPAGHAQPRNER